MSRADCLIVSCEHGGNRLPARFRQLFSERFLATHRGYDPGALALARDVAAATAAPLFYSTVSRLLVELNRPLDHPQVFSTRALRLPEAIRDDLLRRYYFPYWRAVEGAVRKALSRSRRVVHLSCHSFTPKLAGVRRTTDVGLLFDPRRRLEARFCRAWRAALQKAAPRLRVRYNDPYRGAFPSVVHALRQKLDQRYVGIQIEVNQRFPRGGARRWLELRKILRTTFEAALRSFRMPIAASRPYRGR